MMIALPVAIISGAFANEVRRRDFIVTWGMLARVPLFSHLRATEIADIMRLLRAQTIEHGEILVRRGEPASSMYFIAAGEVEIELPAQRVRLADGTFFGEIALLQRTQRSGTVTALRKSNLLALDAQDFHALIERVPETRRACPGSRQGAARRYRGSAEGRHRRRRDRAGGAVGQRLRPISFRHRRCRSPLTGNRESDPHAQKATSGFVQLSYRRNWSQTLT